MFNPQFDAMKNEFEKQQAKEIAKLPEDVRVTKEHLLVHLTSAIAAIKNNDMKTVGDDINIANTICRALQFENAWLQTIGENEDA